MVFAAIMMVFMVLAGLALAGNVLGDSPEFEVDAATAMTGCYFATLGVAFFLLTAGLS